MWGTCRLSDLSFLTFLHFSPVLLLFLAYSPGHASAPYIQTLCDLYCWMSDLHMLYWEHICAYKVRDTQVVKWPSSPELVSTKWWEEVSQFFFLLNTWMLLYCTIILRREKMKSSGFFMPTVPESLPQPLSLGLTI